MKNLVAIFTAFLFLFGSNACRKNRLDPYTGGVGPGYFPTNIGSSWVYQVDSIHYDKKFSPRPDTFQYWIKNTIESEFVDHEGKFSQSFTRYYSADSVNWTIDGTFSVQRSASGVIRNQNNFKEIILKFPIQEFDFWDGNSLNSSQLKEFEYLTVHVPKTIKGIDYDSTCSVLHENILNRVQTYYKENTYAMDIGLVHRKDIQIDEKDIDTEEPKKGSHVIYQLISFEK